MPRVQVRALCLVLTTTVVSTTVSLLAGLMVQLSESQVVKRGRRREPPRRQCVVVCRAKVTAARVLPGRNPERYSIESRVYNLAKGKKNQKVKKGRFLRSLHEQAYTVTTKPNRWWDKIKKARVGYLSQEECA
eukprot:gene29625-32084_t